MITFELAKQLKDAGFPLKEATFSDEFLKCTSFDGVTVYVSPTLSELIEACGDKSVLVITIGTAFTTVLHGESGLICNGSTPEEAVAKLWLELNKK